MKSNKVNNSNQKVWFGQFAQPYYVTMDNDKNLLEVPIAYEQAQYKSKFISFLKKSLEEYKKRK